MKIKRLFSFLLTVLLLCTVFCMGFPTTALTMTYEPSAAYKSSKYYTALCNVQLTGNQRTDIVNIALSQEGYYEGNNLSQLNGMTKGANDYTEYGYWYSKSHPNYAWCAIFINWCARQAGIPTSVISTSALAAEGNLVKNYYAYSSTANIQPGDLLHIKNSYGNHVAMVYAVDSENIYSIEGNMSDMVRKSYYKRKTGYAYYGSSEYIGYYAKPSYTSVTLEGESTLMLSNPVYPSGNYPTMKSFGLSGTFISNYPITTVSAYVYNKDNVAVQIYETNWSSTTYDIAKNGVDANMIFGDLPTNSNYTYTVSATDLSGKTVSKSSSFSIGDPTKQPPASTLKLTSPVGPSGVFATMKSFGLSGTFTSNYKIISVKSWISDDTGKAVQSYSVNWNSTTYDIAKNGVDANMIFGDLSTNANYTYKVQATDTSGKTVSFSSNFAIGTVTHTVTYNANGGAGAPAKQTKAYGTALTLSKTVPTRDRYNFLGWATSASASKVAYQPGATFKDEKNVTLYAVWQKIIVAGDIDDDGYANAVDAVYLQAMILGKSAVNSTADLNGDGVTDVRDLVHLKQLLQ